MHFIAGIRKFSFYKCGCKGWCTYYEVFKYLNWALEILGEGTSATHRHDNKTWKSTDDLRKQLAGQKSIKGCLVHLKTDWMEYGSMMVFPIWSNNIHPCTCCNTQVLKNA